MHPRPFFWVFGLRSGPSQGFSRIRRGIRRHPRVRCAHVVRHVKVLGQSFPYENTKREKTFFLPPDEKGTPTIFKPAWPRRTYDPQELTYDLRPFKVETTTLKHLRPSNTLVSTARSGRSESWKRQTCKRHIKDKTLEETRSPETPFGRQPGIQR